MRFLGFYIFVDGKGCVVRDDGEPSLVTYLPEGRAFRGCGEWLIPVYEEL